MASRNRGCRSTQGEDEQAQTDLGAALASFDWLSWKGDNYPSPGLGGSRVRRPLTGNVDHSSDRRSVIGRAFYYAARILHWHHRSNGPTLWPDRTGAFVMSESLDIMLGQTPKLDI